MAENYVLLETINLSQAASTVTLDNLPTSGYSDLKIVVSARSSSQNVGYDRRGFYMAINGGSTAITVKHISGAPGSFSSSSGLIGFVPAPDSASTTYGNLDIYLPNYLSTSAKKSISVDCINDSFSSDANKFYEGLGAALWNNISAVTSITFSLEAGNFVAGSTFGLYGIAQKDTTPVTAPFASGGNIVANDGTYWYHAFLTSGTFTPLKALSCDLLVVGGGAGGAKNGGGGAGVLTYSAANSLTTTNYTVTVGAGGAGSGTSSAGVGTSGEASSINSISGAGGTGGRGISAATNPLQGGDSGSFTGGAGAAATIYRGGGGGAGTSGNGTTGVAAGSSGNNTGGAGGIGSNTYSSWASATSTGVSGYYASGGGGGGGYSTGFNSAGGSASSGGGGAGGAGGGNTAVSGTVGTANTGGGGGGGGVGAVTDGSGVAGGSGIVIVRYTMV